MKPVFEIVLRAHTEFGSIAEIKMDGRHEVISEGDEQEVFGLYVTHKSKQTDSLVFTFSSKMSRGVMTETVDGNPKNEKPMRVTEFTDENVPRATYDFLQRVFDGTKAYLPLYTGSVVPGNAFGSGQ